jgi:hypothetical protein
VEGDVVSGVWACRACIERGGAVPASGPEYVDLGWCGAGGHKAAGLWWFPDGLATLAPPPAVAPVAAEAPAERMPPEVRRERAQARERASAGGRQLSFLDQL